MRTLPAALVLGTLAGCGSTPAVAPEPDGTLSTGPEPEVELALDFEQTLVALGGVLPEVANAGAAPVRTQVVTLAGGRVTLETGVDDGDGARFPAFRDSPEPPVAVLLVHAQGEHDPFSPGLGEFRFGADFRLDAVSAGDGADNGDNLVQRGLFAGGAQYKLQIDKGVPSCRVAGADGVALVKAEVPVLRERWYRLACTRHHEAVTLTVQDLESSRPASSFRTEATTGTVDLAGDLPLAVGGKVGEGGVPTASSTDQFNGAVDNVLFEALDAGDPDA